MISIVIPTFNERDNVREVAVAVRRALTNRAFEVIFVDDSVDDTMDVLKEIAMVDSSIRYEHRVVGRGLGTAVVRGFELAHGDVIAVMDADLQHPPEFLLQMISKIEEGYDVVIPSRFIPGGSDGGLSFRRKVISGVARYMARIALKRVRHTTDPTSGFFMFRRKIIDGVQLRPIGWKILIEVLVRGRYESVAEISYSFHPRASGDSKMSLKEQWNYIKHLTLLIWSSPEDRRLYLFACVGVSGVLLNSLVYMGLVKLSLPVEVSGLISALVALASNFTLNDRITWRSSHNSALPLRAVKYFLTSLVGIGIDVGVLSVLYRSLHTNYLLANLAGIIVATVWNFTVSNLWVWRNRNRLIEIVHESVTESLENKI